MWRRADQAAGGGRGIGPFAVLVAMLWTGQGLAAVAPPPASAHPLAAECDALIASAVKTPYGWGWKDGTRAAPAGRATGRGARVVTIDVAATASAGLVLHLAGGRLGEPRYTHAALQAARTITAVQSTTGQVPAAAVIGANAGGRDAPLAVPSRATTCAALGLLLSIVHDTDDAADGSGVAGSAAARRAAMKAAHWLVSQQTRGGGWLVTDPPGAVPGEGTKLVRLDGVEYRDATVALWLAARVLEDERLLRAARRAVEELDALRLADERNRGFGLWTTAYTADRTLPAADSKFAPVVDTPAARHSMEALMAACLLGDEEATRPVLREASAALAKLPKENGAWRRRYGLVAPPEKPADDDAPPPGEDGEVPPVSDLFAPAPEGAAGDGESEVASGVDEVVRAAGRLEELGPDEFRRRLNMWMSVEHRLALMLCGLGEGALTMGPPAGDTAAADADEFVERLRRIVARTASTPKDAGGDGENGENGDVDQQDRE